MANYKVTDTELTSIANAIRTKGGTQAQLEFPSGFVNGINNIDTEGGTEMAFGTRIVGNDASTGMINSGGTLTASSDGFYYITANSESLWDAVFSVDVLYNFTSSLCLNFPSYAGGTRPFYTIPVKKGEAITFTRRSSDTSKLAYGFLPFE